MKRQSACSRNDVLVRKLVAQGESLTAIAKTVGTNHHRVREYIDQNMIPHQPFGSRCSLEKNGRWKGGRILEEGKYVLIKRPDHPFADRHGYVREHRLVMEEKLGRYLAPTEVVHHKDGNPGNNSIENLELFHKNGDHLKHELAGRTPKWTPSGLLRIMAGVRHAADRKRKPSHSV